MEMNLFKIPIEEYECDMRTESAKEKKREIVDLFTNSNHLRSKEEFKEIESVLHKACRKGDLELIKICLSETIENKSKSLKFKIDETNRTASLFKVKNDIDEVIIPRTFVNESHEYLITSIISMSDNVKILKFAEDSTVKTIYESAFSSSNIEEIYFPASLKELKEDWCLGISYLTKLTISPLNGQLMMIEDKYLVGKSDENQDEFDILLFARRDINEISIPSHIKIISSNAFSNCKNLTKIEIPPNSNLQTIGESAFSGSNIEEIYFPASLKELKEGWSIETYNLNKITISPLNGQFMMKENKYLIGKSDENQDEFDILLFARRDINEISIPSNIKIISSNAFSNCKNLTKVEIPPNLNLQTIGEHAFSRSKIKEIFIPPTVSKICEYAFYYCKSLTKVEFPPNSNLQTIEKSAFSFTNIKEICFPSSVLIICKNAFYFCAKLTKVEFPPNSNLQTIGEAAFSCSEIKEIFIPSSVSKICKDAFYDCAKLTKVAFPPNSNLQIIEEAAFIHSRIKEIFIPSTVLIICKDAFYDCTKLTKIEIPPNSNLQTIGKSAFSISNIKGIFIPSTVTKICENAFSNCSLQIIEFSEEIKLKSFPFSAFQDYQITIIIW